MDLCLPEVQVGVIPFSRCIRNIEDPCFGFKSKAQTKTQVGVIKGITGNIIFSRVTSDRASNQR